MVEVFTFNRHPSYIHLLSHADVSLTVYGEWDEDVRPKPANVRTVAGTEGLARALREADVWLSHLLYPDLWFFLRQLPIVSRTKLIVQVMHGKKSRAGHVHGSLRKAVYTAVKQRIDVPLRAVASLCALRFVFISEGVARSWRLEGMTIRPGAINLAEMDAPPDPETREGYALVVGNRLDREHFATDFLCALARDHRVVVCGTDNEAVPFETEFVTWERLQDHYRRCLCYLNLLSPPENPFNLATLEAMSAGAPVLTSPHPESTFVNDKDAVVCSTADQFSAAMDRLATDADYRARLSANSHRFAEKRFPLEGFIDAWNTVLTDG